MCRVWIFGQLFFHEFFWIECERFKYFVKRNIKYGKNILQELQTCTYFENTIFEK